MRVLPMLALAAVALAGCGEAETAAVDREPSGRDGGPWSESGLSGRIAFKRQPEGDPSTAALFTIGADGTTSGRSPAPRPA